MYQLEKIRKKISENQPVIGANILLSDCAVSEIFGFAGCDYVWIDMEHSPLSYKDTENHLIAAHSGGAAAFVRIPWNDPVMISVFWIWGRMGLLFRLSKMPTMLEEQFPPADILLRGSGDGIRFVLISMDVSIMTGI